MPGSHSFWRGHDRLALITDIAMGEFSTRELAKKYDATPAEIGQFSEEHGFEIAEVRAALAGQLALDTAGMWIVKKQNRLAELQEMAEDIRELLGGYADKGLSWSRAQRDMVKAYIDVLRATADELGAYPQRASAPARTGQTVHYVIETENTEALQ